jgi:hypothetical protein
VLTSRGYVWFAFWNADAAEAAVCTPKAGCGLLEGVT